jgi:hypothetical protein
MVRFKFQIEGYDSDWLAGAAGARGLRDAVEQLPTSNVPCQLSFQAADITGDQLKNFLALLAKCWRHIQFGATPPSNPWSGWRERTIEELDFARLLPPNMTFDVETSVWSVITSPCSVKSGAAVLLRLVNMLEWSVKFSDRIKLTTNTPFKFDTFEEISKHCRPAMNFPERRPEPEPAAPADEMAAMLQSIANNLRPAGATSIAFANEQTGEVQTIPLPEAEEER